MGQLIVMPRAERSSQPVMSMDGGAEILFFTGVRYYRMPDAVPAKVVKSRRRRRPAATVARTEAPADRHA